MTLPKPIYAFADSSLFFLRRPDGSSFLDEIARRTGIVRPTIAYIGASNEDNLEVYHSLFESAMEGADFGAHRMILSRPAQEDAKFLEQAKVVVLAGGDVLHGWRVFNESGLRELILRRFFEGVVLLGVSAGAVQLGLGDLAKDGTSIHRTFGLLPFYVGTHGEQNNWAALRQVSSLSGKRSHAFGIPRGGGICYQNGEIEIIKGSLLEISIDGDVCAERTYYHRGSLASIALPHSYRQPS